MNAAVPLPTAQPVLPLAGLDTALLLDHLACAVLLMDADTGRLHHANPAARDLLANLTALPTPVAALCEPSQWALLASGGGTAEQEVAVRWTDASAAGTRWWHVSRQLLPRSAGHTRWGLVMLRDTSQRHLLERALQESHARFREVSDAKHECLLVTSPDWRALHYRTPAFEDLAGMCGNSLLDGPRGLLSRVDAADQPALMRCMALSEPGTTAEALLRLHHPQRGLRWVRLRARLQLGADGTLRVYLRLSDVTAEQMQTLALQESRDQAQAASRAKSAFLANISHELRTPINGMLGMTHMLLDTPLSPNQQQHARTAQRCAQDLLQLVDDMLSVGSMDGDELRGEAVSQDFNPTAFAQMLTSAWQSRADAKALRLSLSLPEPLPRRVHGHPELLRRALEKLLDNAIKFTERGGIKLEVGHSQDIDGTCWLSFVVEDTGIGVHSGALPLLFTPFTQVDASLARRHGGAGLGLALARQWAETMGGAVHARSTPGHGSIFMLRVPVQPLDEGSPSLPLFDDEPRAREPMRSARVLVVEDNPVNLDVITHLLQQAGCSVHSVSDAPSGLRALHSEAFDLVMMDIHLPGMDGMEALSHLRRAAASVGHATPATVPVVAVTANALPGDEERLRSHGFDDYIPKPLSAARFHATLSRWLNRPLQPLPKPAMNAPAAAPSSTASYLDASALEQLRALDPQGAQRLVTRVAEAFIASLDRLLPQARAALGEPPDLPALRHVTHTLKSSAASLGAMPLSALCSELEQRARNGQHEGWDAAVEALAAEAGQTREALLALIATDARAGNQP